MLLMSSCGRWLGQPGLLGGLAVSSFVGAQGGEDDIRETSSQQANGFGAALPGGGEFVQVSASGTMPAGGDADHVQCGVDGAIAAAVQSDLAVAATRPDRVGAVPVNRA